MNFFCDQKEIFSLKRPVTWKQAFATALSESSQKQNDICTCIMIGMMPKEICRGEEAKEKYKAILTVFESG